MASMVFSKVGVELLFIFSISFLESAMASVIAGRKCSVFILSKGGVSKGGVELFQ
jgi:hypothetical protein